MKKLLLPGILFLILFSFYNVAFAQNERTTLYTNGRYIYTPCNEKVVLRGVNKMIIWTGDLKVRHDSYAEIRKTGANCIRIVWLANPDQSIVEGGVSGLDKNIQDCIDNKMIPIVELHDATGDWKGLQTCVNYWISPEVATIVKKHEKYLIINIANECGDDQVTDDMYKAGYESAVQQIRNAGIKAPLLIDASDWGKNLGQIRNTAQYLIGRDTEHNLIFSVHMYWAISDGANAAYITNEIQGAVDLGIPLIVGEFTALFNKDKLCNVEADYKTIIRLGQEKEIGWLAWEWGPGNEFYDKSCDVMNMTSDSYYNTLRDSWAKEIALTSPYSISNTSVTSKYITNGGKCDVQSVSQSDFSVNEINLSSAPNPFVKSTDIRITLNKPSNISLKVYNSLGQIISTVTNGYYVEGDYNFVVNHGTFENQGIYYCILSAGESVKTIKLIKTGE